MTHSSRLARAALAGLSLAALAACSRSGGDKAAVANPADRIFFGGPIYTGVDAAPTAEAVAVDDGRVLAVGTLAEIKRHVGPGTEEIDLGGAAMYPGFVDAHAHLLGIGQRELTLNLEGVASLEELVDIVSANAQEAAPGETIYGRGWIESQWPERRFPNRGDLDAVAPDNPVILERADGHAMVVNSAALKKAGIGKATKDPAGGRVERDAAGEPTGMLIDNAMTLVAGLIGAPTPEQRREAIEVGAAVYADYGWTGMHNVSVEPSDVAIIEQAAADGALPIRVYNAIEPKGLADLAASGPRTDNSGRVVTRALKFYVDGALGSRGAALLAPYADAPRTSGLLLTDEKEAMALFESALRAGVQVNTHAIGDRANRLTLDWYEAAFKKVPAEERREANPRWRIEHAQIINPADLPRFAALGVIPSMQPSHAITDFYFAPARLGDSRLDGAYAWRSLIDAGSIIAGGSDAPVERGDPLIEFYAAVARKDLAGKSGPDWRPEERVTRAEALKMFTLWPAVASFQEADLGVIEKGKKADFTVFGKDIMTIPEQEIPGAKAAMTVVDGEIVFRAEAPADE